MNGQLYNLDQMIFSIEYIKIEQIINDNKEFVEYQKVWYL